MSEHTIPHPSSTQLVSFETVTHENISQKPSKLVSQATILKSALDRLAPWVRRGPKANPYPGRYKLIISLLSGAVSWSSFASWLHGNRPIPASIAYRLAEILEARIECDAACAAELRRLGRENDHVTRRAGGFEIVRDRNGIMTDGRGSGSVKGTKRRKNPPDTL